MYYLRKESHEKTIGEIIKTDGTIIPERKYVVEDRALYKSNRMNRFYRRGYPNPRENGLSLYTCKKLSTILKHRENLYGYCGEYFDVYDENGKLNMEN